MTSSESREQALRLVFQSSFSPELTVEQIAELNKEADDVKSDSFALSLARAATERAGELDAMIEPRLVRWTMDRLPRMSLCILRLSIAEVLWFDRTPDGVAANEAVKLAKKYIGEKEASFINGVLGSVIREKNGEPPQKPADVAETASAPADDAPSGDSADAPTEAEAEE